MIEEAAIPCGAPPGLRPVMSATEVAKRRIAARNATLGGGALKAGPALGVMAVLDDISGRVTMSSFLQLLSLPVGAFAGDDSNWHANAAIPLAQPVRARAPVAGGRV